MSLGETEVCLNLPAELRETHGLGVGQRWSVLRLPRDWRFAGAAACQRANREPLRAQRSGYDLTIAQLEAIRVDQT